MGRVKVEPCVYVELASTLKHEAVEKPRVTASTVHNTFVLPSSSRKVLRKPTHATDSLL
jgi:hypothetical protein